MIQKLLKSSLIILACVLTFNAQAQVIFSPYTAQGLGDVNPSGVTSNLGMAGLGMSYGSIWHLNIINPALLTKNSNFTTFEIGLASDLRRIEDDNGVITNFEGGLNYAILGFPVMKDRWVTAIGYRPLTVVNFNSVLSNTTSDGTVFNSQAIGKGGLSEAFWSHGVKLNRNFSLGVQASYVFGGISREDIPAINPQSDIRQVINSQLGVSDLAFTVSGLYNGKVGKDAYVNLGGGYSFEGNYDASLLTTSTLLPNQANINPNSVAADTIVDMDGSIVYPAVTFGGISYEKKFKWAIGVNYRYQNWENFENFNGNNQGLFDSHTWVVGSEWTPDVNDVNSYFNRVAYRVGARYEQSQYESAGKQVDDFGISFGLGLPVKRASYVNFGMWLGRRGWDEGQLQENYIRWFLGFTFNDKWFIRRKYN